MGRAISRRRLLKAGAAGAAASLTAAAYARVKGANDRISIGVIGCGGRGFGAHMTGIHKHDKAQNVEINAVCDVWRQRRERAVARVKDWYGVEARSFVSYRDLLALKDLDAVTIASCDHQHTTHLEVAARAGLDVYCEKPLAMDIERLERACDAVRKAKIVFQAGTQLRSLPSMTGVRAVYKTGILGTVSRVEQRRNSARPYWYGYLADAKEKDVAWDEFLMDRPKRPFRADLFTGWYGYREFSDGPLPGLGSHFVDLVHYITGATYPRSAVCHGGRYAWKDEHNFTCPDQIQALWDYPEGFLVSYSTNFGNSGDCTLRINGDQGTLDFAHWSLIHLTAEGAIRNRGKVRGKTQVKDVPRPDHFLDWLQCLRTRKAPNANIEAGHQHAVACLMAMRAFDTGRRQVYDPKKREMRDG